MNRKDKGIIMDNEAMNFEEMKNVTENNDEGVELTVCDSDAAVEEAVYETEACEASEESKCACKTLFAQKCKEVTEACRNTATRLVSDWKVTDGKPYVKQTTVCRVDIYRSPEDETPVDTFCTERVRTYSARAMAIVGAAAVAVFCTADTVVKKLMSK